MSDRYGILVNYEPTLGMGNQIDVCPSFGHANALRYAESRVAEWVDYWGGMVGDEIPAGTRLTVNVDNLQHPERWFCVLHYPEESGGPQVDVFALLYPATNEEDVTQCVECGAHNALNPEGDKSLIRAMLCPTERDGDVVCTDCAPKRSMHPADVEFRKMQAWCEAERVAYDDHGPVEAEDAARYEATKGVSV